MMTQPEGVQDEAVTRMACALCRRRKLRCDRQLPCDSCVRLGFMCSYEASRSYQGTKKKSPDKVEKKSGTASQKAQETRARPVAKKAVQHTTTNTEWSPEQMSQEDLAELEKLFFSTFHSCVPMLHEPRYIMGTSPESRIRPPNYLRYIICALAACVSARDPALHFQLYRAARGLLEEIEYHDAAAPLGTLARPQAWLFVAFYELLQMQTSKWCMSASRAVRLAQMMGLHVLDSVRPIKRSHTQAKDWVELEEQRRTFWVAFCVDRYAALDYGCPVIIAEADVHCLMPVSERAYQYGIEEPPMTLEQALIMRNSPNPAEMPPAAALVSLVAEFGRKLKDLQRTDFTTSSGQRPSDLWQKVNFVDDTLRYAFSVPPHLADSGFLQDPMLIYLQMAAPCATIILHRTAEEQASSHGITPSSLLSSQALRLAAAEMVAATIRLASQLDVSRWHPLTGLCLFDAARVFMRALAMRTDEGHQRSLKDLLDAIGQLQAINPQVGGYYRNLDAEFPGMRLALSKMFPPAPSLQRSHSSSMVIRSTSNAQGSNSEIGSATSTPHMIETHEMSSANVPSPEEVVYQRSRSYIQDMSGNYGQTWQSGDEDTDQLWSRSEGEQSGYHMG